MTVIDDLLKPEGKIKRGRYQIVSPDGGERTGYTRATTISTSIEDKSNLIDWKAAKVALGMARNPGLVARAATADQDDKAAFRKIALAAADAGGANEAAEIGTAIHAALEVSWHDLSAAPSMFATEAKAVHEALKAAGLSVVPGLVERVVVNDTLKVAGTFDLVLTDGTTNYIADVKSGKTLLGALGYAIQLYLYATADSLYDHGIAEDGSQDVRSPMPDLDKTRGVILHIRRSSTECDLHWIDLEVGAAALDLAMQVRETRKAKPLSPLATQTAEERTIEKVKAAFPGAEEIVGEEWRGWFRGRLADISKAGHMEQLRVRWPVGVPTLASGEDITATQADLLEAMTTEIEAEFTLAFPAPKPGSGRDLDRWVSRVAVPDVKPSEGPTLSVDHVAKVNQLASTLDPEARQWMKDTLTAANKAKRPIRISGNGGQPTKRKVAICTALAASAALGPDFALAIAEMATNRQVDERGFAHFIGGISIDEAQRMTAIAHGIHDGQIGASIALNGSVSLLESDVVAILAP